MLNAYQSKLEQHLSLIWSLQQLTYLYHIHRHTFTNLLNLHQTSTTCHVLQALWQLGFKERGKALCSLWVEEFMISNKSMGVAGKEKAWKGALQTYKKSLTSPPEVLVQVDQLGHLGKSEKPSTTSLYKLRSLCSYYFCVSTAKHLMEMLG